MRIVFNGFANELIQFPITESSRIFFDLSNGFLSSRMEVDFSKYSQHNSKEK